MAKAYVVSGPNWLRVYKDRAYALRSVRSRFAKARCGETWSLTTHTENAAGVLSMAGKLVFERTKECRR
jgi:hypothetical protein